MNGTTASILAATVALVFFGCSAGHDGDTKQSGTKDDEVKGASETSTEEARAKEAPANAPAPAPSAKSGDDVPGNFEDSCSTLVSCSNGVCKCGDGTICEVDQCALQCRVCM